MEKKAVKITVVSAAVFLAAQAWGPSPADTAPAVDLTLPSASLDFDDGWDVRDAQGRPVASPEKTRDLRRLFVGGLYALLMRADLPRLAEVMSILERAWNACSGAFRHAAQAAWQVIIHVWCPPVRRFAPPGFLLLGLLLAVLTAPVLFLSGVQSPRLSSHLSRLSSTVIRR